MYIPYNEMHFFNTITLDELGEVFEWNNHILRGIKKQSEALALSYFQSGFLNEIISKNLFPKTTISTYTNERYCMILEHERITPAITDSEWSYSMMKDAALMVLDIALIGMKYGYKMLDCHTKNVMFSKNRPIYVDLGSFIPVKEKITGYYPYRHFLSDYYYILKMWNDGLIKIPKQLHTISYLPEEDYFLYKYPFWRFLPSVLYKYLSVKNRLFQLLCCTDTEYINSHIKCCLQKYVIKWSKYVIDIVKPFKGQHIRSLCREISNMPYPSRLIHSFKEDDFCTFPNEVRSLIKTVRDVMIINSDPFSIVLECDKFENINNVIVADCIEGKGDSSYIISKNKGLLHVTNVVFNICFPLIRWNSQKIPEERMKVDVMFVNEPSTIKSDIKKPIKVLYKTLSKYQCQYMIISSRGHEPILEEDYSEFYYCVTKTECNNVKFVILKKR